MSQTFDCTTDEGREAGIEAAVAAVRDHEVVVLPTDTVYGVGADAFSPDAVRAVLDAKGRGADMPPPVLIPHARTVDGLATEIPAYARDLMDAYWPGPLTLVLLAAPSLMWDLGETNGTVALRVPEDDVALAVLAEVGPMAVTSANLTGRPAALNAREALLMLGDAVRVYLDGGPVAGGEASTILDCTQEHPRILRPGALAEEDLQRVLGDVLLGGPAGGDDLDVDDPALDDDGLDGVDDAFDDGARESLADADDGELPSVAATEDAGDGAGRHRRAGEPADVPAAADEEAALDEDVADADDSDEDYVDLEHRPGTDRRDAPGASIDPNL